MLTPMKSSSLVVSAKLFCLAAAHVHVATPALLGKVTEAGFIPHVLLHRPPRPPASRMTLRHRTIIDNLHPHAGQDNAAASSTSMSTPMSRAKQVLFEPAFTGTAGALGLAGALLGPNLDNYHSAFGVLSYKNPVELMLNGHVLVTTDWWVPPLFAVAGAGIGALYILLDAALETPLEKRHPMWRDVFLGISLFSFQYYLSGLLVASESPYWLLVGSLLVIMERMFRAFDSTTAGFIVSLATAVLGPAIEVVLVNATDLYVYNGADFFGVDSWIPVVYFCGGPAVGNLARALYRQLCEAKRDSETELA